MYKRPIKLSDKKLAEVFQIQFNRLSNLTGCQVVCMVDFVILFVESFLVLVTHVLFCYSSCFMPQCTSSGSGADLLTKSIMDVICQPVKFASQLN